MTKFPKSFLMPIFLVGIFAFLYSGCTKNKDKEPVSYGTCEGCHTDYTQLKLVYSPDTAAPAGGCGGEAPHYEPYDRVYMGGTGYNNYKGSSHDAECTSCHNGVDNTSDKVQAHSGDFLKHPSTEYVEKCGTCHSDIATNFSTNLHNGIGQKRKVTMRSGLTGHEQFDQLPAHKIEGYTANCATCHGTCGNCHVVRPPIAGGGLNSGHDFKRNPDMLNTCISCHSSRGGHAYLGRGNDVNPDIVPDVHLTHPDAKFECLDCHTGIEIHGNGEEIEHRYAYSELPTCTASSCHPSLETKNSYHSTHYTDFNCQVCHSQDYNSCGSCHIHGEGARQASHLDFKIAQNPLLLNDNPPNENHDSELALVRRTLGAPDNWAVYHDEDYTNFNEFPIFNYTTPHNIQKWTTRTNEEGTGGCFINCHIRAEGGQLINKELYLFMDDLVETWQVSSTGSITLDGELPISWFLEN